MEIAMGVIALIAFGLVAFYVFGGAAGLGTPRNERTVKHVGSTATGKKSRYKS